MEKEILAKPILDRLANDNGLAIALVDAASCEISVFNNSSICHNLNPDSRFAGQCAAFCGTAFKRTAESGTTVAFTCHAGLECRAVLIKSSNKSLVAIVGRTFTSAHNYKRATQRSISGDWSDFPPNQLYENILLTASVSILDKTAERVADSIPEIEMISVVPDTIEVVKAEEKAVGATATKAPKATPTLVERFNREVGLTPIVTKTETVHLVEPKLEAESTEEPTSEERHSAASKAASALPLQPDEKRIADAHAWRSFVGSLLKNDYSAARRSILEFLAQQYKFSALIWLEKKKSRLENAAAFGEMKGRKVRLGIASDDKRLVEASQSGMPLKLNERSMRTPAADPRTMSLFPIGVGGDISAGIAILDPIADVGVQKQIAHICQSLAPQLEILRLRSEVARGRSLSNAVREFSEGLKRIDADDLWLNLTQNAAEMLRAERASLLIYDEKEEKLEIIAIVGAKFIPPDGEEAGKRVAKFVFAKNQPILVPDVSKTGLSPAEADRRYKTDSFLSCPISIGSRTIGVMSFTDKASGQPFDRASLDLFEAIAPQLAIAIDRASLKEKAGEFEQLSVTDALTGLLNRRYIEARLLEEVKRSNRHGFPMCFMMVDVDHFKSYNDQFGHPAGDEALKLVGHVIRETLRGADVAARFGGEEFSILLPQTTRDEADAIAERVRQNVADAAFQHRPVTVSIGVASCSADLCSAPDIVSAADKALYEAKRAGRNRVVAFEEMPVSALEAA